MLAVQKAEMKVVQKALMLVGLMVVQRALMLVGLMVV